MTGKGKRRKANDKVGNGIYFAMDCHGIFSKFLAMTATTKAKTNDRTATALDCHGNKLPRNDGNGNGERLKKIWGGGTTTPFRHIFLFFNSFL
jgi:hypothetical protein